MLDLILSTRNRANAIRAVITFAFVIVGSRVRASPSINGELDQRFIVVKEDSRILRFATSYLNRTNDTRASGKARARSSYVRPCLHFDYLIY